jgi:hypothetical protein
MAARENFPDISAGQIAVIRPPPRQPWIFQKTPPGSRPQPLVAQAASGTGRDGAGSQRFGAPGRLVNRLSQSRL